MKLGPQTVGEPCALCCQEKRIYIVVAGESLVDLVQQPDGTFRAIAGGSPFNVAIGLARQSVSVTYISPLSRDSLGGVLAHALEAAGAKAAAGRCTDRPTALAVVSVGVDGTPSYSLYREGVADRAIAAERLVALLPPDVALLHTGSLALVPDDLPRAEALIDEVRARGASISIDVNVRPSVIGDHSRYVAGLRGLLPRCDLIKLSDEDALALNPNIPPSEQAAAMQAASGGWVALTLGAGGAKVIAPVDEVFCPAIVAAEPCDTIGCGDSFQAGLLAFLFR